jgi:DNA replication licensing factor MCM5
MLIHFSRDQIRENVLAKKYACDIDMVHLISYNEELAHRLNTEPAEIIPIVSSSQSPNLSTSSYSL